MPRSLCLRLVGQETAKVTWDTWRKSDVGKIDNVSHFHYTKYCKACPLASWRVLDCLLRQSKKNSRNLTNWPLSIYLRKIQTDCVLTSLGPSIWYLESRQAALSLLHSARCAVRLASSYLGIEVTLGPQCPSSSNPRYTTPRYTLGSGARLLWLQIAAHRRQAARRGAVQCRAELAYCT